MAPAKAAPKSDKKAITFQRFVEVGRVVLLTSEGPSKDKLAVIVEIIDQNRVLLDGAADSIVRGAYSLKNVALTKYVIDVPRGARSGAVRRALEKSGVEAKFSASSWGKKLSNSQVRKTSTVFDRFKVRVLKKQIRDVERKALFSVKKSAKA